TEQKRAEEELKISHKTYLGIINSLTEAIYIQDENGVFLEVNKAAEKFYGYPKEYFIGKTPELISAPGKNDIPMIAEAVKKAFNGESQSFEFWGLRKNGTIFPKSVNLTSGEYFGKKVVIATARDITERIRAKLELQVMYEITHGVNTTSNLDELLKLIHASLKKVIYAENCFVALHDQNTGLFSFPYFVDKFDPTPMPIAMRKSCTAYVFRTGKPLLLTQELFERLVEQNKVELVGTNSPSWLGVPLLTPSRTIGVLVFQHYEEENVYSEQDVEFLDSAGNQIAIAIERKRAEEAIQESQKNFMDLFDNAPIGYHEIDSEGRITRINSTELEMLGYTYDEMIGQPIWKYNSDEKLSYQAVQKKLSGKLIQTQAFERCLKRKDGTRVLVLIEEKILKDNAGKITGIRTTLQDITERKRAEEALRESEERFTAFMNNSPIVAWLKDPVTWTFCYINSAFEEVFDITQEVITRKTDFDLWPEEIARQLRENDLRVLSSDKAIQTSEDVPLPDGTVHHWLVFKFPLHTPSGKRFLAGTAVDITERKQAEDEIISQKNKFAQLFENSPIAIALLDDQGKIVQINESFSALFDYYHDEIKGKALNDIIVPPEFKEEAKSYSDQAREGNQINKESYRMRKDGAIVYVQIVGIPVIVNEKTVGIYGMYVDLTQRKNSEEALIIAKELAENAAELKSEFLAQMSHEIRTPLNIIASNSNLLKDELEEVIDTDLKSCFLSMEIASKRIIRTVDLILNMSQIQTDTYKLTPAKIDLVSRIINPLIKEYDIFAQKKNISVSFSTNVVDSTLYCDEYSVTQIFANLIDNAIKFTPKGKVEVSLFNTDQGKLIFEIKDTGVGMYAEFIQNLFQPFSQEEQGYQRTFDGNGLGLALVKKYCELNDASIEVESKKNIGSTFRVIFNQ
ncbi:MAG: PAS domain S-box protein, partial [Bacteroidota bacterium]